MLDIAYLIQYSITITICTGKPPKNFVTGYCDIHFIVVICNRTSNTSECTWTSSFCWYQVYESIRGFSGGSVVKNLPGSARSWGFDPWIRKTPWRRKWQPIPVFFPGDPMDIEAWWAIVHGVAKSWTQLSNWAHTYESINTTLMPCTHWICCPFTARDSNPIFP